MNARLQTFLIALVGLMLCALGAVGCNDAAPSRAAVDIPEPIPQLARQSNGTVALEFPHGRVPGMTVAKVEEVELPSVLEANGQVDFDQQRVSTIVSRVAGRIEGTRVSQWDSVRRGEPIVSLYSPDFMTAEAEYLQARETVKLSSSPGLAASGNLAATMVTAAERKLELLGMDETDIHAIRMPSPTVWVRAPISGIVLENKAVRGAAVSPGDVLYTLGTLNDVWIVASIYEDDLARVHTGQALVAVTTAYPDRYFHGFISRISPNIDPNTHTLQIRCEVRNPGGLLKPQMLARIRIVTNPGNALVVPQEALVFDTNRYYAFVEIRPDVFQRRAVEIAAWRESGYARVLSGLVPGDKVVVKESIQVNTLWHQATGENS
ncbi:MAG: efflux RND transporter periplasmic adaptor subunit [Candidatus Binataceae bacterium]